MKTIIEGVLAVDLPWGLVGTGAGISVAAMLCGVSGLAFAIGVYLPLASMLAIFVGGCVRARVEHARGGKAPEGSDAGILAASGLVAGEGLAGVLAAGLVAAGVVPKTKAALLAGHAGEAALLLVVAALCFFLHAAGRAATRRE